MNRLLNIENVKKIVMRPVAYTKCKIGQDWFINRFEIEFYPDKYYPDYMEVNSYINKEIEGKEFNIEQAAKKLHLFLLQYDPKKVIITDHIRDCKTHFDVDVIIE